MMVSKTQIPTDTWVNTTWAEYLQTILESALSQTRTITQSQVCAWLLNEFQQ